MKKSARREISFQLSAAAPRVAMRGRPAARILARARGGHVRADSGCEPLHVADDTSRGARGARAARFLAGCQELREKGKTRKPKLMCHVDKLTCQLISNLHANSHLNSQLISNWI